MLPMCISYEMLELLNRYHRPTSANASDAVFPSETLETLTTSLFELSFYSIGYDTWSYKS